MRAEREGLSAVVLDSLAGRCLIGSSGETPEVICRRSCSIKSLQHTLLPLLHTRLWIAIFVRTHVSICVRSPKSELLAWSQEAVPSQKPSEELRSGCNVWQRPHSAYKSIYCGPHKVRKTGTHGHRQMFAMKSTHVIMSEELTVS